MNKDLHLLGCRANRYVAAMADTDTVDITLDVSEQLDVLIIRYFQTLADVFKYKRQLENDMKDGFLYMAKARYTMGSSRVGRLQYNDADLGQALVHVDIHPPSDSSCIFAFHPNIDSPQTTLTKSESPAEENESSVSDSQPTDLSVDIPSGLRKRKVHPADAETDVRDHGDDDSLVDDVKKLFISAEELKKDGYDSKSSAIQDPLHWFGILIPMALRQSQAAFRRSVATVCNIASLQSELLDIREQYHAVLKVKHRLSTSSAVAKDS